MVTFDKYRYLLYRLFNEHKEVLVFIYLAAKVSIAVVIIIIELNTMTICYSILYNVVLFFVTDYFDLS